MKRQNLAKLLHAALNSGSKLEPISKRVASCTLSHLDETAEQTRKRSERIKEDKTRGARITTHRISI